MMLLLAIIITVVLAVVVSLAWRLSSSNQTWYSRSARRVQRPKKDIQRKANIDAIRAAYPRRRDAPRGSKARRPIPYGPALTQRLSVYTKGRQFDDSFAIENADKVFFGECGAAIAKSSATTSPRSKSGCSTRKISSIRSPRCSRQESLQHARSSGRA
ncbi:MAG: hypothetical protein HND48_07130 [Chloroflexi bacterium]|nr:hypothetical protein [Chloroflexota bacterium]